jgi:hypothetical protein
LKAHTRVLVGVAGLLGGAAATLSATADDSAGPGIVCWTDDHGVRACGDHVPPQYARKQRDLYNDRGMLVQTFKAEETPEQRAENERKQREAQQAQQQVQQQQQNDSFMLQTYRNVDDLKAVRDSRLQSLDTRIDLGEKAVRDGSATLKDLQDRADADGSAGKDANPELLNQIKSFESSQSDNIRALAQLKQDREAAATRFDRDIRRYQELRGVATPAPLPTPVAAPTPQAPAPALAPKP